MLPPPTLPRGQESAVDGGCFGAPPTASTTEEDVEIAIAIAIELLVVAVVFE